jgi:hypothetical protein
MDAMIKELMQYGVLGVVVAVLFFQQYKLQSKLIEIIEKNTKAFDELKGIIEKCQLVHKD